MVTDWFVNRCNMCCQVDLSGHCVVVCSYVVRSMCKEDVVYFYVVMSWGLEVLVELVQCSEGAGIGVSVVLVWLVLRVLVVI